MMNLETAILLIAGFATIAAFGFIGLRVLGLARNARLMRCPESGAIAFVETRISSSEGATPKVAVCSCDLWPERKDCARGCLERYEQTEPGFRVNVEALRPFDRAS